MRFSIALCSNVHQASPFVLFVPIRNRQQEQQFNGGHRFNGDRTTKSFDSAANFEKVRRQKNESIENLFGFLLELV